MKEKLFISILVSLTSLSVLGIPTAQSSPSECYKQALPSITVVSEEDADRAAQLCRGARSTSPSECYKQALPNTTIVSEEDAERAAQLCRPQRHNNYRYRD